MSIMSMLRDNPWNDLYLRVAMADPLSTEQDTMSQEPLASTNDDEYSNSDNKHGKGKKFIDALASKYRRLEFETHLSHQPDVSSVYSNDARDEPSSSKGKSDADEEDREAPNVLLSTYDLRVKSGQISTSTLISKQKLQRKQAKNDKKRQRRNAKGVSISISPQSPARDSCSCEGCNFFRREQKQQRKLEKRHRKFYMPFLSKGVEKTLLSTMLSRRRAALRARLKEIEELSTETALQSTVCDNCGNYESEDCGCLQREKKRQRELEKRWQEREAKRMSGNVSVHRKAALQAKLESTEAHKSTLDEQSHNTPPTKQTLLPNITTTSRNPSTWCNHNPIPRSTILTTSKIKYEHKGKKKKSVDLSALPPEILDMIFEYSLFKYKGHTPALLIALRPAPTLYARALPIYYRTNLFTSSIRGNTNALARTSSKKPGTLTWLRRLKLVVPAASPYNPIISTAANITELILHGTTDEALLLAIHWYLHIHPFKHLQIVRLEIKGKKPVGGWKRESSLYSAREAVGKLDLVLGVRGVMLRDCSGHGMAVWVWKCGLDERGRPRCGGFALKGYSTHLRF